ncbi:Detected protein of unknown function [Hibiscus syriacus]|uniref:Uncharacterized protein n=1 Tax=Hibiscus syriacus TaxID=106335 RepID=A0A6A2YM67_HIBSY|nr:Detected protein of unknown function [Hibiscus syriacus]
MESCSRPNRSDVHLSLEEEAKMEEQTREYFHDKAPKRHTKPQRSEYSSNYVDATLAAAGDIPEYLEFQRLENEPRNFSLEPDSVTSCHSSCKGNPATNDWIPAAPDAIYSASGKPNRSDS